MGLGSSLGPASRKSWVHPCCPPPNPKHVAEPLLERVFCWPGGTSVGRRESSVGLTEPSVGLSGVILGLRELSVVLKGPPVGLRGYL